MRILFDFVYSITAGVSLYCSCLSGNIQKPLHPCDWGAQHKGREQGEQVWADELEPPGLWMESHASCNIDLHMGDSLRVDDGEIGTKKPSVSIKGQCELYHLLGKLDIQYWAYLRW